MTEANQDGFHIARVSAAPNDDHLGMKLHRFSVDLHKRHPFANHGIHTNSIHLFLLKKAAPPSAE